MASDEARAILAELLQLLPYYNVATVKDGEPWNSPVWAARDENFDLFWSSWTQAVHSTNIAVNPSAFLTLYDSTRERGTNNFRCLYLKCRAVEVTDPTETLKAAHLLYPGESIDISDFQGIGLKRFYKATPVRAWLNCLSERQLTPETIKMRLEISLQDLRAVA